MSDFGSTPRSNRAPTAPPRTDLGPERLAMGFSRRPPGLWTDVEVDAELRRSRQLIHAFAARDAAIPDDGDSLGQAYAADPCAARGDLNGNRSEYDAYRRQLHSSNAAETSPKTSPDSLGGEKPVAAAWLARPADQSALVPLWLGVVLLTLGLTFLAFAVLFRPSDWWLPGLPFTILGQAALTLGLLLRQRGPARV